MINKPWLFFLAVWLLFLITVAGVFVYRAWWAPKDTRAILQRCQGVVFEEPRQVSLPPLVDQNNNLFSTKQLLGKPTMVFFGFTHCLGVCPVTMRQLDIFLRHYSQASPVPKPQVVMVSVDQGRDGSQQLHRFLANYSSPMLGVSGEEAAILSWKAQLGVSSSSPPTKVATETDNYQLEHSTQVYLLGADGTWQGFVRATGSLCLADTYRVWQR